MILKPNKYAFKSDLVLEILGLKLCKTSELVVSSLDCGEIFKK